MTSERHAWNTGGDADSGDDSGSLVRPYIVTRGRTNTRRPDLQLITIVFTTDRLTRRLAAQLEPEHFRILSLCSTPTSVVELSARIGQSLNVTKILIGDLINMGLVLTRTTTISGPDPHILQAVLNGIRRL